MTVEKQPLSKLQRDSGQRKEKVCMAKRKGLVLGGHQFRLLEGDGASWPAGIDTGDGGQVTRSKSRSTF